MNRSVVGFRVLKLRGAEAAHEDDALAVEAPLAIRVAEEANGGGAREDAAVLSVTMRTPGADDELAVGFLFAEGVIAGARDLRPPTVTSDADDPNAIVVHLAASATIDRARLERNVVTTSSCGACGKTSIDALAMPRARARNTREARVDAATIRRLPGILASSQPGFASTGGVHATAQFERDGSLVRVREDVGRHNAFDKVIGAELLERGSTDRLEEALFLVSGRASFELVQKAVMARVPIVAAVGAPSSLAVQLAEEYGVTLIGFVRGDRFNVYTAPERVVRGAP